MLKTSFLALSSITPLVPREAGYCTQVEFSYRLTTSRNISLLLNNETEDEASDGLRMQRSSM